MSPEIHDVVGYYNRFDIFKLRVDRSANRAITFERVERDQPQDPMMEFEEEKEETLLNVSMSKEAS